MVTPESNPRRPDEPMQLMSDGETIPKKDVLHYKVEEEPTTDEEHLRRLKIGAFSAASLGLAIFGGVAAYKHLKDK